MLLVGMDVGGSRTRAAVVDAEGRLVGAAEGQGGNPVSHPGGTTVRAAADVALAAMGGRPASDVGALVIGMAGAGSGPLADATADALAVAIGVRPQLVGDVVVAFAAGTSEPVGTVLVAGTGAASARIVGRAYAGGVDGHGWLLGDVGSAFWLGRSAVRAALAALDARREPSSLAAAVTAALLGGEEDDGRASAERLVEAVHARPPIALAELAPLVDAAATSGDTVALRIVARAADALVAGVEAVRAPEERTPIVLAGSVAAGDTPVAARVRAELSARWAGCVATAGDTARAAAWLAATRIGAPCAAFHATVVGGRAS